MFRIANLLMVLALLVTAAVVYQVKYASTAEAERLAHLRAAIRAERDSIAIMRAEWARRTAPLYVQGLVQRHLDLQPLSSDNISTLDDLPEKPSANGDGIGGMIEALVDAPLTTSTVTKPGPAERSPAAATGSGASGPPAASALRNPNAPVAKPAAKERTGTPVARNAAPAAAPSGAVPQAAPPPAAPPAPFNPFAALGALLPPGILPGSTH
ncbi:hypothetical protein [Azorhizobium sp. AG788]|uniref:cell division protein FtsL n=1 Tax=Azorhizobium sp. AG788 TaxID=2183897 RepID=UPI0031392C23